MKLRTRIVQYVAKNPWKVAIGALVVIVILVILCASCSDPIGSSWKHPAPEVPAEEPIALHPIPPAAQVVADTVGNALTLPWLVTLAVGEADTFRVRLEGTGDHELVLFQVDTLVARFTPNWQVESRRGSLVPSDFTGLLEDAQVLHVEREHFGAGGFHEWSVPIEGKAVGKAQVFFLWQREDGSQRAHGSFEVRVEP